MIDETSMSACVWRSWETAERTGIEIVRVRVRDQLSWYNVQSVHKQSAEVYAMIQLNFKGYWVQIS